MQIFQVLRAVMTRAVMTRAVMTHNEKETFPTRFPTSNPSPCCLAAFQDSEDLVVPLKGKQY